MPSSKYRYLPYHRRNRRRWLIIGLIMIGAFLIGIVAGIYLWEFLGHRASIERDEIARRLDEAESVIAQSKLQIAVYENASRVDQLAVKNTQNDLKALQDKLLEMGKELEFYRRIVSPKHREYELRIQSFRIYQNQQFALTLSQGIGRDADIRASARIQFTGRLNGIEKVLELRDVDKEKRSRLEFAFRYFQTETVGIDFPDGFELERVNVSATPRTKEAKTISRTWNIDELETQSDNAVSEMGDLNNLN